MSYALNAPKKKNIKNCIRGLLMHETILNKMHGKSAANGIQYFIHRKLYCLLNIFKY